ncbi:hypothetical protein AB6A40_011220 [Gnathostoma spinigerum]|uniref:guanylate cyclase n=1 Tax=Gnathostoma spinigerum TaxID=75299 RepID=A0ABD6EYR8_9BILA
MEPGISALRIFELTRPQIPFDFESICNFINSVFVLQAKHFSRGSRDSISVSQNSLNVCRVGIRQSQCLQLKGQMLLIGDRKHLLFICSPCVTSIPEILQFNMRMTSIPLHDVTRDIILLNQQRLSDMGVHKQLEENNAQLEVMANDLQNEKAKTEALLKEMLPTSVAQQLIAGHNVEACQFLEFLLFIWKRILLFKTKYFLTAVFQDIIV